MNEDNFFELKIAEMEEIGGLSLLSTHEHI